MTDRTSQETALMDSMEQVLLPTMEHDEQTAPLFHYTDAAGFKGIIETGEIWATHFDHLNDRNELRHGEEIVLEEAKAIVSDLPQESPRRYLVEEFIRLHPRARLTEMTSVYVASFSEAGDQLSQWRAYGSDGSGFAVGFCSLPLPKGEKPTAQAGLVLLKCEYDPDAFRKRARRIILEVANGFEQFLEAQEEKREVFNVIRGTALRAGFIRIAVEIPRLKHRAFSEEKEWRFVVFPRPGVEEQIVKFQPLRNGLRPYVEIGVAGPDKRIDLSSVVIGPCQDVQRSLRTARMFLKQHLYTSDEILQASAAPYRGGAG